jgi:hypothetical protein
LGAPRGAFRTAAHIVASYAASRTSDANGRQPWDSIFVWATGRAEQRWPVRPTTLARKLDVPSALPGQNPKRRPRLSR